MLGNCTSSYRTYRYANLAIRAACPLDLPLSESNEPDLFVEKGNLPNSLEEPTITKVGWSANSYQLLVQLPSLGRLKAIEGHRLILDVPSSMSKRSLTRFVLDFGLGPVFCQRGDVCFQGSVARVHDKVVLICGPPGCGKTVLALELELYGGCVLSDGLCRTSTANGQWNLLENSDRVRTYRDAFSYLGHDQFRACSFNSRIFEVLLSKFVKQTRIDAVIFLQPTTRSSVVVEQLCGSAKALALCQHISAFNKPYIARSTPKFFSIATQSLMYKVTFPSGLKRARALSDAVYEELTTV